MPRIVVVGSSNTDMTVRLPRLPAPGQTVLGSGFATTPGGKGANQAVAACRAGGEVVFITAVGDDDLGRNALDLYRRQGIDVSHAMICDGVSSGVALIFVGDDGENMIGVASGAQSPKLAAGAIDRLPDRVFRAGDVLMVGLEIPVETAVQAIERGARAGMRVILNPSASSAITEIDLSRRALARRFPDAEPARVAGLGGHGFEEPLRAGLGRGRRTLARPGLPVGHYHLGSRWMPRGDGRLQTERASASGRGD